MISPRLIGIAGGSGSGKTTLATALAAKFGKDQCARLAFDAFYRPLDSAWHHKPEQYNFDAPEALEVDALINAVSSLKSGINTVIPVYDFSCHDRVGSKVVRTAPWIVVEGVLLFSLPKVRDLFDFRVFVETPEHIRLARRIQRDTVSRGRHLNDILEQYFRTVRPMHEKHVATSSQHADVTVAGTEPIACIVDRIFEQLVLGTGGG